MPSTAINFATTGDHNLGLSTAGKLIRVQALYVYVAANISITIKDSSAGVYTGPMPLSTTQSLDMSWEGEGYFDLTQGADLNINATGTATQVSGFVDYVYIG